MNKKKRESTQNRIDTQKYAMSLFFVLTSLGITVVSLFATSRSGDIRQQAQIDPYLISPTLAPISTEAPTKIPVSPTKIAILPTEKPATPTKAPVSPTKVPASPTKVQASPTKTPNTQNNNYAPSPTKAPPTQTPKTITLKVANVTATKNPNQETTPKSPVPTVKSSTANSGSNSVANSAPSTPLATNKPSTIQTVSNTTNTTSDEDSRRADERIKEFLALTDTSSSTKTTRTQTTAAKAAQTVLRFVDTASKPSTTASTAGPSNNGFVSQTSGISSQQVFQPAVYIPETEVITKVAQVGALNSALINQKNKETLNIVVEDKGQLISHKIPVPKNKDGVINQAVLQSRVANSISQANSGTVVSAKSVDSVSKANTQSSPGAFTGAFNALGTLLGGTPAQQTAQGAQLLKDADVVVKTGTKSNLPIKGQQINVHFDQKDIVINQISHENLNVALGQQIAPVTALLQTALNASSTSQTTSGGITPVNITQHNSNVANLAAAQMNLDQSQVAQVATIQTLATQLGASGANVEYLSNNGLQKAYIVNSTKNQSAALKAGTNELSDAQQGKKTVGEQLEKFTQSSGLSQALGAIAFPGIEKLAKEQKLHVQVIRINTDLNAHPDLDVRVNTEISKAKDAPLYQPQAIIIVDDFGNQKVHVFGNEAADKLQNQIEANPPGLFQLINTNLQNALNK